MLKPTTIHNPCPVCGKTNGNCRHTDGDIILCMSEVDTQKGEIINNHKKIGLSENGLWSIFISVDAQSNIDSEEYKRYKEAQDEARLEQFKGSLPVEERNKNLRAVVKHLGLSKSDRKSLQERGLSDEEIDNGWFASLTPFSPLPSHISIRLAGIYIGRDGKPTIGSDFQQGIICPTFNQDSQISGYQIMRTKRDKTDGAKYVWGKTSEKHTEHCDRQKISSHLQNGELPINFHYCKDKRNKILWWNDGNLKTYIAHCLHGIDIIGCAGGNFAASIKQSTEIAQEYKEHIYALDGGDILNRAVIGRLKKLAFTLKKTYNIELLFAWWGQTKKDNNDIDEIQTLEYDLLNIEQLLELANKEQFRIKKQADLLNLTNFTPTLSIKERYISNFMSVLDLGGKITGIKSVKCTGKSYWLKLMAKTTEKPIILLGSRQILTCNLCGELGITYIDKTVDKEFAEFIFDEDEKCRKRAGIVADSLLKLKDVDWTDAIVIIDEAEQFLEHLILAETHLKKIRGKVLGLLAKKLAEVHSIILLDADLSDFTCNYFTKISNLPLQKIENLYVENDRNLVLYSKKDSILGAIFLTTGKTQLTVSDSAKDLTALYNLDIEKRIKSVLLTRDSIADNPKLNRFLKNKGRAIRAEGIKNVYLSPVGQSGISIEIDDYFDLVFGIFNGAIGTNTARQLLLRDRGKSDRHVWISERGLGYTTNYETQSLLNNDDFKKSILLENLEFIQELEKLNFKQALNTLNNIVQSDDTVTQLNDRTRASLLVKNNLMKSDFQATMIDELKAEGYQINFSSLLTTGNIEIVNAKKEELLEKQSIRIELAPEITESQAEILSNKSSLKESERDKLLKHRVQKYLPDFKLSAPFILEYILKDNWKKLKAVNNYFLVKNPEICNRIDANSLSFTLNQFSQKPSIYWMHDIKQTRLFYKIYSLLELDKFITKEEITLKEFNHLKTLFKKNRRLLRSVNIKFNDNTKKTLLLNKVFGLIGHKVYLVSEKRDPNTVWSVTKQINNKDIYDDVYQAIELKYSEEIEIKYDTIPDILEKIDEIVTEQAVDLVPVQRNDNNSFPRTGTPLNNDVVRSVPKSNHNLLLTDSNNISTEKGEDYFELEKDVTFIDENDLVPELPVGFYGESEPDFYGEEDKTSLVFRYKLNSALEGVDLKLNDLIADKDIVYKIVGFWNGCVGLLKSSLDFTVAKFKDILFIEPTDLSSFS